ncbi:2-hydroxyacid dehydrogenase [Amorphus sp. MBR-141]
MSILFAARGFTPEPWRRHLEAVADGRRVVVDGIDAYDPSDIRYAVVWQPPRNLLAELPNLDVIFNLGAGVDALLADTSLPARPIVRVVDPDMTGRMTEWIVLQVLTHHRGALRFQARQRAREWVSESFPAAHEVRVGVMGMGVLGSDAAAMLQRLGYRVTGWNRSAKTVEGIEVVSGAAALDGFLARTDILVVLLPLTPETRGLLDASLFARLARDGALGGPMLINAGRGGLQIEADIVAALEAGTLKGASLDVFETEPLPATSPLWDRPEVVITPHVAAESNPPAICRGIVAQIAAFERGDPLQNVVDRTRGY